MPGGRATRVGSHERSTNPGPTWRNGENRGNNHPREANLKCQVNGRCVGALAFARIRGENHALRSTHQLPLRVLDGGDDHGGGPFAGLLLVGGRRAEIAANLKHEMIARGMSAEEVQLVLEAGS